MAFRRHNRYISKEQFADGTTIDGSRIDNAMQDVVNHVNQIPAGDLKNRYTQTQFVFGWSPAKLAAANAVDTRLPWMQAFNNSAQLATVTGGTPNPPEEYQNPQRAKGYGILGVDALMEETTANGAQYIWTIPIHFGKSVIIRSLEVFFMLDTAAGAPFPYTNTYQFTALPDGSPSSQTMDVTVQLLVDRPRSYGSEDRRLNQLVANKTTFVVNRAPINLIATNPVADMFPTPYPGGNINGRYFELRLDEPLPEDTRARINIIIPDYTRASGVAAGWGTAPWLKQYYSATLTVLEELES